MTPHPPDPPMRQPTHPTPLSYAFALVLAAALASVPAWAQTQVSDAWVRATVAPGAATGLFARLTSMAGGRLIAASSPLAGAVEIHEMSMDGNVMRMRALTSGLDLPAGQAVELGPGGVHVMLFDLKRALKVGEALPVTLVIEGRDGRRDSLAVTATVRGPGGRGAASHPH